MRQSMNKTSTVGGETSVRVIEEIVFQASLLALHTAIESAGNGTGQPGLDSALHSLVERARPPAGEGESSVRPDTRGV
jgi:hypothetical protein